MSSTAGLEASEKRTCGDSACALPVVIVVGGGVSGCACAASLASRGVAVTVVSAALDTVGQPAYGPVVIAGGDDGRAELRQVMSLLPAALREVWLDSAVAPAGGGAYAAVDRRMLSIETKRALERLQGLRFRQGLVVDIRVGRPGGELETPGCFQASECRLAVDTAFGEVMEADVVIVATGLSAGGHVVVGEDVLPGGRYGETPAEGLLSALEALGGTWVDTTVDVGPRFMGRDTGSLWLGMEVGNEPCCAVREQAALPLRELLGFTAPERGYPWPKEFPPAPQWSGELGRGGFTLLAETSPAGPVVASVPDGVATAEVYVIGEVSDVARHGQDCLTPTRPAHVVHGRTLAKLNPSGRLRVRVETAYGVWATGRVAGARDYLESLRAGVSVADDVIATLGATLGGGKGAKEVTRSWGDA